MDNIELSPRSEHSVEATIGAQVLPNALNNENAVKSYILPLPKLFLVCIAFTLTLLVAGLDQAVLSTSLATIVSDFHAVSDLTWIASAYFLPQAGFTLLCGRILAIAPAKIVFLLSIVVFELGSLCCAVAPSVQFLIFGRALSGTGAAALWLSVLSSIAPISILSHRPLLLGFFAGVFALSAIVGPLIGGALTDSLSWRWCFWINLPCGGLAILFTVIFLPNVPPPEKHQGLQRWLQLDFIGAFLGIAATTILLLALQWGGNTRPWNDPVVIGLLITSLVLLIAFLLWEYKQANNAILPLWILCDRNMPGACLQAFFVYLAFQLTNYYLPLIYQVKGHSAVDAGVAILPLMIAGVLSSSISGAIMMTTGHVWPFLVAPPFLAVVGYGLLYTVMPETTKGFLSGCQILIGVGFGPIIQVGVTIAQAQYNNKAEMIPQATSLVAFLHLLGAAIGPAISSAVFTSKLSTNLHAIEGIPASSINAVTDSIEAIFSLPLTQQQPIIRAYINAIVAVFLISAPAAGLSGLFGLLVSRKKMIVKV